ncbi:MAG: zinc-binding dehydrogenase [Phycisphaerales bacterium]|jgi:NADPH:quinone reductase-like Zn-dependent oxidoreductase|nr:zinc-binding dehydrogenase [Phycisphaerales bacterium]
MNAVVCTKQGSPVTPNIEFRSDWPEESGPPAPGWVRIRTLASAFNHMDLWVGRGVPGLTLAYPRVSGCDGCGVVEQVGAGVDAAWVGRRVVSNAAVRMPERVHPDDPPASTLSPNYELIGEHHNGSHRAMYDMPAANIADVGDADPIEAAAFALTTLTAYSMIVTKGGLRPGQSVLITGIGGGVATSALSIAKWMGCPVVVTSRHQWKLDAAKKLGADHAVLDAGQDWSKDVRAWTNKRGVDMAVDSAGKATHLNCIKSLARGGAYVTPGCTSGPDATTDLARIFWNQLRVLGSTMGSNEEFHEIVRLFRAEHLRATVDKVFPARKAPEAYARLEAGEQFGKIVLDWREI